MSIIEKIFSIFKTKEEQKVFDDKLEELEDLISYTFTDKNLLRKALMHRSFVNTANMDRFESNENLEFLGDAVLGLVVSKFLYYKYPTRREGDMARIKSLVVSEKVLARYSKVLELGKYIYLSKNERKMGGAFRSSILADTYEALLGAIYLDGGYAPAEKYINDTLLNNFEKIIQKKENKNFKSLFQEYIQGKYKIHPEYEVIDEDGPEHKKTFYVQVVVNGEIWGKGMGNSKKEAEQNAAAAAIENKVEPEETDTK